MTANDLDRLLRSAANSSEASMPEPPFGFATRVLAAWRAQGKAVNDIADLSRFLRTAGAIACAVLVLAGTATYRQYGDETKFANLATNEYAIADSAIQTEFSQ